MIRVLFVVVALCTPVVAGDHLPKAPPPAAASPAPPPVVITGPSRQHPLGFQHLPGVGFPSVPGQPTLVPSFPPFGYPGAAGVFRFPF